MDHWWAVEVIGVNAGVCSKSEEAILSKLAPVLELKLAAAQTTSNFRPLKVHEQQRVWDVLKAVLPTILAGCSGISVHPDNGKIPFSELLWDFLNGREICISLNKRGGYNLSIKAEKVQWMESQLPLELLLLKVLALDYTPMELRELTG